MRRLLKVLMAVAAAGAAMSAAGLFLARRMEGGRGFSDADDFRVAAVWGGREFTSTARRLTSGWAEAVLAGISLDLRDAVPAPGGTDLWLRATLGGIAVSVPGAWRVEVERHLAGGAVEVRTPDPGGLPADAPVLRISATARSGGILITTGDAEQGAGTGG